ncbi:MAG TPA: divergent polysaccharide deacetylase family protein [Alphaproteobacteria bacterium]|nr:divergent polysaccharide deacetylase family protein [Alphaproteobacteria bacterium]
MGADKKAGPTASGTQGRASLLLVAWAALIGLVGGAVLWGHFQGPPEEILTSSEVARLALTPPPAVMEEQRPTAEPPPPSEARVEPPAAPAPPAPPAEPPAKPEPAPIVPPPPEPPRAAAPEPAPPPAAAPEPQRPTPQAPPPPAPPAPAAAPTPQTAAVTPRAPAVREAAQPAWLRFSRPFDANDRRPRVAVIISELGLSSAATTAAIQQMPADVTLAFSPYADSLDHWIGLARAAGHEVLLNLPMEPINFPANDPGPRALLTSLSAQQNLERLDWVLGRIQGYVGVTNHMGSRFTTMPEAIKPVLSAINDRGLMFVDSRASTRSIAAKLASDLGLPRAINDRQIDQEASRPAIDGRLAEIERIAREAGSAVAMAQPYPVSLERLREWLPTLETKGLVLAPITAVANRQPDR